MDMNKIIILIIIANFIFLEFYCIKFIIKPELDRRYNLKTMELKNKQFELFSSIDIKQAEDEIDNLINKYLADYTLENFIITKTDYIQKSEVEKMVQKLTKQIYLDLSEVYLFYIKILININSNEDLLSYIRKKVKEHVLSYVSNYNAPK